MKRFTIKLIVLFCLLIALFTALNKIFTPFHFLEKTMIEYQKEKGNIDIVIFGSSHAHNSFDIRLLESELNLRSFNFGSTAQRIETTQLQMDQIINENNLKLIIVDIFSMSIDNLENERSQQLQLKTLDYLPFTLNKIKQSDIIFDKKYLPYALSPFLRKHSEWKDINFLSFSRDYNLNQNSSFYDGFYAASKSFNNKTWIKFENKYQGTTEDKNYNDISSSQKKRINKVIELANKSEVPILFTNSPSYVSDYDINYNKTTKFIKRHLKKKNIPFIDFDQLRKGEKLQKKDFQDPNHLNTKGALKVTDSLVNYIRKRYQFRNIVDNSHYFSKNKFYQIKHNFKKSLIREELSPETINKTSILEAAIIKPSEGRLELIIQTEEIKTTPVKFEFELSDRQFKELFLKDKMYIKKQKYFKWGKLNKQNSFEYNGKHYKSFQFYFPFDQIKSLKVYTGKGNKIKLIDVKNIKISS